MAVHMLMRPRFPLQVPDIDLINDEMTANRKDQGMCALLAASPEVKKIGEDVWEGFTRVVFHFRERESFLVLPSQFGQGNPWIWRPTFFGAWPEADLRLLTKGFHLAYTDVLDYYAAPDGIEHGKAFHDLLVAVGLASRFSFVALSRGGLFAFRYSESFPQEVQSIYADAPVCDVRSWPGGQGKASRAEEELRQMLRSHRIEENQAFEAAFQPLNRLAPLAKAGIPLLHVCGMSDVVVPYEENTFILERNYRALGGEITFIPKPGVGHHPHGLEDPTPIVSFIERHSEI